MSYFTVDHKISVAPLGGGVEIHEMPFGNVIPQEFLLPSYVFELQKFSAGSRRGWDMLGIRSGFKLLTSAN